jgi:hypothetical protein
MILQPVRKLLPTGETTRNIFQISRRCLIGVLITFGTLGPTTALGGDAGTRSFAKVAIFSHAARLSRPSNPLRPIDPPDTRPDPSGDDRAVNQLYQQLMRESARVLNSHE